VNAELRLRDGRFSIRCKYYDNITSYVPLKPTHSKPFPVPSPVKPSTISCHSDLEITFKERAERVLFITCRGTISGNKTYLDPSEICFGYSSLQQAKACGHKSETPFEPPQVSPEGAAIFPCTLLLCGGGLPPGPVPLARAARDYSHELVPIEEQRCYGLFMVQNSPQAQLLCCHTERDTILVRNSCLECLFSTWPRSKDKGEEGDVRYLKGPFYFLLA